MSNALWSWDELVTASGGQADGAPSEELPRGISGASIDTRTLSPGDLFVALKDVRDGHEFVPAAFAAGAVAALVSRNYERKNGDGALIRVDDPLRALEAIGRAARARTKARIAAVTGSVGKTGTKEMLRNCLMRCGKVHASDKSYNNQWGVPLTLARMPADTEFGIFEIGMNHANEIMPLSKMVRPHVALITTVEPVHLGHFDSVEAIADAKAEIFTGLEPDGVAILNRDNPYFERLRSAAEARGARIVTFGEHESAQTRLLAVDLEADGSVVQSRLDGKPSSYRIGVPGRHIVQNTLGALSAVAALGADTAQAALGLAALRAPAGRGARETLKVEGGEILLVDESYNASPASMRAALAVMATIPRTVARRRIAVLGDMRELGAHADRLHAELAPAVVDAGIDLVFAAGPHMLALYDGLPKHLCGKWAQTATELRDHLLSAVRAGDAVMVKGSLGSRMGPLVEALKTHFRPST